MFMCSTRDQKWRMTPTPTKRRSTKFNGGLWGTVVREHRRCTSPPPKRSRLRNTLRSDRGYLVPSGGAPLLTPQPEHIYRVGHGNQRSLPPTGGNCEAAAYPERSPTAPPDRWRQLSQIHWQTVRFYKDTFQGSFFCQYFVLSCSTPSLLSKDSTVRRRPAIHTPQPPSINTGTCSTSTFSPSVETPG